jgi:3-oxoacyl-[acyl-carrier protein] reductase
MLPEERLSSELAGRRIVVIGGTGGIGVATVRALLEAGADVLATGRDPDRLCEVERTGARVTRLDLADEGAPSNLGRTVERHLGSLDGMVATAGGYGPIGPTRSVNLGALRTSLQENLLGPLGCIMALAPFFDSAADPSIVLLSGGGATAPLPNYAAYSIAKVATVRLVEMLAIEEPRWRVNAVAPGFVATRIHESTLAAGPKLAGSMYDDTQRQTERAVPPERAAALIAFLLGPRAAGITGRLVSAVWDAWDEEAGQNMLRDHPTLGRLRRVDGQRIVDAEG